MDSILSIKNLCMNFGGINALDNVNIDIKSGEITALIGPNGAGKTTLFNCITGIYKPSNGNIILSLPGKKSKYINGLKPNQITKHGMARTFQNIRLFSNMTALENIMIGTHCRTSTGVFGAIIRGKKNREEEKYAISKSYKLLKYMGLEKYANELARNLPYGEQRLLEISRAMATDPYILLLDEPAAGMNPTETHNLITLVKKIRDEENISIILIEHDMKMVMNISTKIFVMEYGRKIAEGSPEDIKDNPQVIKAYLGEDFDA